MIDEQPRPQGSSAAGPNIFIVHGRTAGGFRDSLERFIEQLGLHLPDHVVTPSRTTTVDSTAGAMRCCLCGR
jgi:hypothetical protein